MTGGIVIFSVSGSSLPSLSAPVIDGVASASMMFAGLAAGSYPIQASFSGVSNPPIASSVDNSQFLTIAKAPTGITWFNQPDISPGTPLGSAQLNAVATAPGTLTYTPASGTVLAAGDHQTLQVIFTPSDSLNYLTASLSVSINVTTLPPGPFGSFDTPAATSNVSGSVGFTGWALAEAGLTKVDIWREQGSLLVYIGDADLVTGARPDIQSSYPTYPGNASAGWGYLILTNELPASAGGLGNGTYRIHAIAHDARGLSTDLGVKTIVVDNAGAIQPFGTIDTPVQGATLSGTIVNFGWALTPPGKIIPMNGSTVWVYIDDLPVGHPVYSQYRADVATLFPGYANSAGAVGYYYIDTTTLANGLHTISWSVMDSAGAAAGIGSRYFTVQN